VNVGPHYQGLPVAKRQC